MGFTGFLSQDIEIVQVLPLLLGVGMQIIVMVRISIIQVVWPAAVNLVVGGIMVDIEILHLLMVGEGVVVDHLVEVLMDLHLVLGLSEAKA